MLVPFDTLPDSSKIWIYQSATQLSESAVTAIEESMASFVTSWTAHQANLKAGYRVFNNRFLVIAVDEGYNNASGCSIDAKVHFIQDLGKQLQVDFFNRMLIAYSHNNELKVENLHALVKNISEGKLGNEVLIYNNLVSSLGEFRKNWKQPVQDSWIRSMLPVS